MEDAAADMLEKQNASVEGSTNDRDARNLQRQICTNMLLTLAAAVISRANQATTLQEKINIANLSKFTLCKITPEPAPPLPQVEGVKGEPDGEGQLLVEWDKIPSGALNYTVQTCTTDPAQPNAVWTSRGVTSHRKLEISGLNPLSKCWVRVIAHGKGDEVSTPSDPVMCVVI